jgi:hypothetical protein
LQDLLHVVEKEPRRERMVGETKRKFCRGLCGWLVQYGGVDDAVKMVQSGDWRLGACARPPSDARRYCSRLNLWQDSAEYRYKNLLGGCTD